MPDSSDEDESASEKEKEDRLREEYEKWFKGLYEFSFSPKALELVGKF